MRVRDRRIVEHWAASPAQRQRVWRHSRGAGPALGRADPSPGHAYGLWVAVADRWGTQTGPFGFCRTQPLIGLPLNGGDPFSLDPKVRISVDAANDNPIANAATIVAVKVTARIIRRRNADTGGMLVSMAELPVIGNAALRRSINAMPEGFGRSPFSQTCRIGHSPLHPSLLATVIAGQRRQVGHQRVDPGEAEDSEHSTLIEVSHPVFLGKRWCT